MLMPPHFGELGAALMIVQAVGLWLVFVKAQRPGWAALIPIYNILVLLEILDRSEWWLLWLLLPLVGFVAWLLLCVDLAAAFSRGSWSIAGLFLAPWLFLLLLGLGRSEYRGAAAPGVGQIEF